MASVSGYCHLHFPLTTLKNYKRVLIVNKLGKKLMELLC